MTLVSLLSQHPPGQRLKLPMASGGLRGQWLQPVVHLATKPTTIMVRTGLSGPFLFRQPFVADVNADHDPLRSSPDPRSYTEGQAIEPAVQYVQKIKQRCDPDTYRQFLDILSRYHHTPDSIDEVHFSSCTFENHLIYVNRRKSRDRSLDSSRTRPISVPTFGFSCLTEASLWKMFLCTPHVRKTETVENLKQSPIL